MSKLTEFFGYRSRGRIGASLVLCAAFIAAANGAAWAQSNDPVDSTKIVIAEGSSGLGPVPLYIALAQGSFKKAGLDVEGQMLNGGTAAAMAAFVGGNVNVLMLSAPELIQYVGNKVIKGKVFAEMFDHNYDLVGAKGMTSIADIKGKIVGISALNAGDYSIILATLEHYGLTANDVTFVSAGNPVNRLAALAAGAIQLTAAANLQRDASMKAGTVLVKSSDSPVQFPTVAFFTGSDLLTNHKPLLKKFVGVLAEATAWAQANQAEAAAICAKTIGAKLEDCAASIALGFDKSVSSKFTWSSTYAVNVDAFKSTLAAMATLVPVTKGLTIDDVVDTSIAGTTP